MAPDVVQPPDRLVYIPIHKQNYTFAHEAAFTPSPLTTNLGIRRAATSTDRPQARRRCRRTWPGRRSAHRVGSVRQREVWRAEREGAANGGVLSNAGGLVFQGTGTGEFAPSTPKRDAAMVDPDTDRGDRAADLVQRGQPPICRDHGRHRRVVGDVGFADETRKGTLCRISPSSVYALGVQPASCGSSTTGADACAAASHRPAATVARGEAEYRTYCGRCHGPDTANYGILPDLRYSTALRSKERWAAVVLEGAMKADGMASFAPVLDANKAEAVRAFVIAQANAAQQRDAGR